MIFQIAALFILTFFYGCYAIKMIMQRKSGIKTDFLGKGKIGFTKWVEIILKIATYAVFVTQIVSIILNTNIFPIWIRISGLIFAASGTIFFVTAVITMKNSWRAGVSVTEKTHLVTSGIFQISRNPAFLGFDFMYIGIVCAFFNVSLFSMSFFAIIMLHLQIVNNEEPFLQETFGEKYFEYTKSVNRYVGKNRNAKIMIRKKNPADEN